MEHAASCLDEHIYIFTTDVRNHFHQLVLALWAMPRVGLLWMAFASHADYNCIAGCSLGFGHSCASNIVLRILDIFCRDDTSFVAADRRRAPGFFAARDSAASQTGRGEGRLAVVHMCTDDPYIAVVGSTRAFLHTGGEVGVAAV